MKAFVWRVVGLVVFLGGLATVNGSHTSTARFAAGVTAVCVGALLLVTGGRS